ncbi:MarR family winged helix-turn-helix transcriptional regulator [Phaeobacter gallaeciensis]|uniref:Transcriptional regulator, MarR family n=1 Tax=Phaeobacter gallaeciensis TaxID=60890 RepID=A0AAD0EC28_9RHOB|nr:MarR family transcriptional regulator [Phaeobacter gallaeciensis]AHD08613.1 transcriptional regulator, MarR family [Phaeobacter gallaeciensis DSM 26640]ATE91879.1 transcriptional regulator, MarR family [Phaeobacter gallaeciensis]ATE98297.1 transcriptional regulator, MarR family [Phaeobacter gallaeciensis]ATF00495.1 transcriptional regulator, MarR family [Phaeobacter gallaeciensis]ATF04926.1 transcriptional regulator, MarR family [Phaeobacter gallaeciensis]
MTFNQNTSAGYLINHLARLAFEGLRKEIEPLGIVPGQFPALLALWQRDGQTQRELVAKTDVEQATMANTLNRMERDGLIVRRAHPEDGRARMIYLTEKAKTIRDQAYRAAGDVNGAMLSDLSDAERRTFIDLLQRVVKTLRGADLA